MPSGDLFATTILVIEGILVIVLIAFIIFLLWKQYNGDDWSGGLF